MFLEVLRFFVQLIDISKILENKLTVEETLGSTSNAGPVTQERYVNTMAFLNVLASTCRRNYYYYYYYYFHIFPRFAGPALQLRYFTSW